MKKKESQVAKIVGYRIGILLTEQKKMQKELADFLDVQPNVVSNFFTGDRTPNLDQIIKISEFFHTTPNYLLGVTDSQSTDNNLQAMCEYTGLSDRSIQTLHELRERSKGKAIKTEYQSKVSQYQSLIDEHDSKLTLLGSSYSLDDQPEDKLLDKYSESIMQVRKEFEQRLNFYMCKNRSEATIVLATINEFLSKSDIEKLIEYAYLYLHTDIEVPNIEFLGLVEDNSLSDNAIDVAIPVDKQLFDASLLSVIRTIFEDWKDKSISKIPEIVINQVGSDENG